MTTVTVNAYGESRESVVAAALRSVTVAARQNRKPIPDIAFVEVVDVTDLDGTAGRVTLRVA